jgi:hypothetical protein
MELNATERAQAEIRRRSEVMAGTEARLTAIRCDIKGCGGVGIGKWYTSKGERVDLCETHGSITDRAPVPYKLP